MILEESLVGSPLVQIVWQRLQGSQMPLAESTHFFIIFSPRAVIFIEGYMPTFFTGPRVGASDENVSPPTTCHKKGHKKLIVSVEKIFFLFLSKTR